MAVALCGAPLDALRDPNLHLLLALLQLTHLVASQTDSKGHQNDSNAPKHREFHLLRLRLLLVVIVLNWLASLRVQLHGLPLDSAGAELQKILEDSPRGEMGDGDEDDDESRSRASSRSSSAVSGYAACSQAPLHL